METLAEDRDADLLTVASVARRIGVGKRRVYQLIRAGLLPSISLGRSIRVPARAWETWLVEQETRALAAVQKGGESDGNG